MGRFFGGTDIRIRLIRLTLGLVLLAIMLYALRNTGYQWVAPLLLLAPIVIAAHRRNRLARRDDEAA
jgi:hypothetical protein